jgi:uncharacterized protein (TIGR03086 family)
MTETADRYRTNAAHFGDLVAGVATDQWAAPTPCEAWTARELVEHVVNSQGIFLGLVDAEMPPHPSVDDDPTAAWDAVRTVVQTRLDDPELADIEFDGFFGRSTFAEAVDRFLSSDLVMHGWDLARATGQDESIDTAEAERVFETAHGMGEAFRGPQVAGPAVAVPDDADVQTRLIAFYGRTP